MVTTAYRVMARVYSCICVNGSTVYQSRFDSKNYRVYYSSWDVIPVNLRGVHLWMVGRIKIKIKIRIKYIYLSIFIIFLNTRGESSTN
jgi:hypothetical protein